MASVALTFFAYLGFAVISFTAGDLRDPARELPRAMNLGIGLTATIYVLVSLGTFGALTVDEVDRFGETALAEAARPSLGQAGFTMMAIAALLATSSSVTRRSLRPANSRGCSRARAVPALFGRHLPARRARRPPDLRRARARVGNLFDLSAIASVGSAVAIAVFLLVAVAGYRRRADTGATRSWRSPPSASRRSSWCSSSVDTVRNDPATFAAILAIVVLAVTIDTLWKWHHPLPAPGR